MDPILSQLDGAAAASRHRALGRIGDPRLNNHGITPAFLVRLNEAGYTDLSIEEMIRIQNSGD